jgi:type IV secretory pathway VirB6-like protein
MDGNAFLPAWVFYGLFMIEWKTPKRLFGIQSERSNENFDNKKPLKADWYFRIPLYTYVILQEIFWVYVLVLVSDKVKIPNDML